MQIEISDSALTGFNDLAKLELSQSTRVFAEDVVNETIRIEASRNSSGDTRQITSSMVADAAMSIRYHLTRPKQKFGVKLVRMGAALMSMVVGFVYDATRLQDEFYMVMFLILVAIAIFFVILSTMLE
ncbi:MAG TPA: hypothetical protein VGD30_15080 [Telluria sp.]